MAMALACPAIHVAISVMALTAGSGRAGEKLSSAATRGGSARTQRCARIFSPPFTPTSMSPSFCVREVTGVSRRIRSPARRSDEPVDQCTEPAIQSIGPFHGRNPQATMHLALFIFIRQISRSVLLEGCQPQLPDQRRNARLAGPEPGRTEVEMPASRHVRSEFVRQSGLDLPAAKTLSLELPGDRR